MANPRGYVFDSQAAVASPTKTSAGVTSATTVRPEIYDMIFGASASPADNALLWKAQRYTAAGTAAANPTPSPLDPADPASLSSAGNGQYSAEPTYTAGLILFHLALNQRASHRWIADPRGPLKMPATANNGIGLFCVQGSFTGNVDLSIFFNE